MKKGKTKNTKFHGILATGHTQEEAANQYRLLALGKGAEAKVDAGRALAFVTTAGATTQLFNPRTGELDLKTSKKILANLSFEANASAATVVAQHYQCTAGCGQHFVYDSKALMKFCPLCVHAVTASTEAEDQAVIDQQHDDAEEDDEDEDDDEDDSDDNLDDEIDDEVGDDDLGEDDEDDEDEDDTSESSDDEDDEDDEDEDEDDEDDSESSDDEDDESESSADDQPLVIAADSKAQAVKILRHEKRGSVEASASVNYMVCASAECGAHVLAEEDGVTACPSCSSTLVEPPAASLSGDDDEDEDDDLGVHDDEDDEDEEDDEDDSSESSDDEDDDDDDESDDDEDEDDSSESSAGKPAKARVLAGTEAPAGTPAPAPAPAAVEAPAGTPAAPQGEVQVVEGDLVKVDTLAQIDDTVPEAHKDLDVSFSAAVAGAHQWIASYKGVPVATARVEDAGDNKSIFANVSFGHAVIAGAQHLGVKATLKEMGFRPVICEVNMPKRVKTEVEAQMVEARAALANDGAEHAERLMAALATAAIGINRGFFTGVTNPLKATLFSVLSAANIKQPEVLIDNAFKATADDYHKVLFAKANDLLANPPAVQESLSKAILGTAYQAVASSAPAVDSFESRVGGMGTVTAAAEPVPAAAPVATSQAHVSQVVASLGKRRV